jgi:serine/threonine-protein kinase
MPSEGREPRVIGRYELHGEIAAGGMATVHFGRLSGPVGFSRTVAIKRLHPQYAKDPEFVTMFLDEARLAARIRHPNVVPTLDVVATDGEIFLVMDYVQGESLSRLSRTLRARGGRVPARITAGIMSNVLHGLHAAHEAKDERGRPLNIVHRDVSPQNILVGTDGISRVLDFGVAKAAGRLQTTREGQIKGKIAYMAPEQLAGAGTISRQTDIYAAAVVLWEQLCGRRLFDGDNEAIVLARALEGRIDPPSKHSPELPLVVDEILFRGLHRDPAKRYQTAREMAIALEKSIGIAPPSEIGEWVETVAGDVLHQRAARIAEIESSSSANLNAAALLHEVSSARTTTAPPPKIEEVSGEQSKVFVPAVPPSSASSVRSIDLTSQVSSISVSRPGEFAKPKPRRGPVLALLVVLGVGIGVGVFFMTRRASTPADAKSAATSAISPSASASATAESAVPPATSPADPVVSSNLDPTPSAPPTSSSARKKDPQPSAALMQNATSKKTATPPPAPPPPSPPPTVTQKKPDCDVLFTLDKDGHKVWKKECLK